MQIPLSVIVYKGRPFLPKSYNNRSGLRVKCSKSTFEFLNYFACYINTYFLFYRKTPGISYINTTRRNVWLRKYEALSSRNIRI